MSYGGIEYSDSHFLREARAHIDALEAAQLALLRRVWRALGCDPNPSDFMRSEQAAMWEQAIKMIERATEASRPEPDDETRMSRDEKTAYLGEGLHTAFRKAGDSEHSIKAWQAIRDMEQAEWKAILRFVVAGIEYSGYYFMVPRRDEDG